MNTLVDSYNLASADSCIAIAAFDAGVIRRTSLRMRTATTGESFFGIGMESPISLTGVEVVIEDRSVNKLIAVYPYRDSDDSKVTEKTENVLFMMCGVPRISNEEYRSCGEADEGERIAILCLEKTQKRIQILELKVRNFFLRLRRDYRNFGIVQNSYRFHAKRS